MQNKMKKILCLILIFSFFGASSAKAAMSLNIDGVNIPKIKVLINFNQNPATKRNLDEISRSIKNNLEGTGLFDVWQKSAVTDQLSIEKIPNFSKFSSSGVDMLLIMDGAFNAAGELEIKVRFWDILDERQLFGKFYSSSKNNYKRLSNLVSDEIFKVVTGEKMGHFDSKIVYVAESGNSLKRIKRIAIMNYDGSDHRYLTSGRDLVLSPIFARQKNELFFVRFFGEKPQIYNLDLNNALVRKVGGFRGTTFAPNVNPKDPNIIAFSVIDARGNSNIYQMNLFNNKVMQLTNTRAIDTTPSYSPDGDRIIFSSDRGGSQQLYMMNSDGSGVRKVSSDKANYSKPMWSHDGKYIAFTKMKGGQFSIGIMDVDGRNEKILTSGYLVEDAKWAPSGRYIIYSRKNGAYGKASVPKLFSIDVLTGFDKQLPTPENEGATDPDWMMN